MDNNYLIRIERYCEVIDDIKALKLLVRTKKQLKILEILERVCNGLMGKERIA